jgi:hypothetical protein
LSAAPSPLIEWVMNTAVLPFSFTRRTNSARSLPAVGSSSAENGSSHNRILALVAKARAIETRWRMPPGGDRGLVLACTPGIPRYPRRGCYRGVSGSETDVPKPTQMTQLGHSALASTRMKKAPDDAGALEPLI